MNHIHIHSKNSIREHSQKKKSISFYNHHQKQNNISTKNTPRYNICNILKIRIIYVQKAQFSSILKIKKIKSKINAFFIIIAEKKINFQPKRHLESFPRHYARETVSKSVTVNASLWPHSAVLRPRPLRGGHVKTLEASRAFRLPTLNYRDFDPGQGSYATFRHFYAFHTLYGPPERRLRNRNATNRSKTGCQNCFGSRNGPGSILG